MRTLHRIALACFVLAACKGPNHPNPREPYLAECASTAGPSGSATGTANDAGSVTIAVGGGGVQHVLQVPPNGARPGTVFVLTALPAPRVGVEAHARGEEGYTFLNGQRATLRISGQHCTAEEYGKLASPTIVRVERDNTLTSLSSAPVQGAMRTLSVELPSLSGYAIGSN